MNLKQVESVTEDISAEAAPCWLANRLRACYAANVYRTHVHGSTKVRKSPVAVFPPLHGRPHLPNLPQARVHWAHGNTPVVYMTHACCIPAGGARSLNRPLKQRCIPMAYLPTEAAQQQQQQQISTEAAFARLQNGSDIRGVALARKSPCLLRIQLSVLPPSAQALVNEPCCDFE